MAKTEKLEGTLEVPGSGKVEVSPDEAVVDLTVVTEASTAAAAVDANAERAQAVIEAVSELPNRGVVTTGLAVTPIYEYDKDSNVPRIIGFRASNTVRVTAKVANAGSIFDAGIEAGANQSSGILFRLQNEGPFREEALRMAVREAYTEARITADAAGVQLGGPVEIVVEPSFGPILLRAEALRADSTPTPVIPEDVTVRANVRVTFETRLMMKG